MSVIDPTYSSIVLFTPTPSTKSIKGPYSIPLFSLPVLSFLTIVFSTPIHPFTRSPRHHTIQTNRARNSLFKLAPSSNTGNLFVSAKRRGLSICPTSASGFSRRQRESLRDPPALSGLCELIHCACEQIDLRRQSMTRPIREK